MEQLRGAKLTKPFNYDSGLLYLDDTNNRIGVNSSSPNVTLDVIGNATVSGVVTSLGGFNIGIQSGGVPITTGVITAINFVGPGNTVIYNPATKTVNISIQGGSTGAGGTFSANSVGVHTTKILGINTTTIAGAANSEGAIQAVGNIALVDGAILTDQNIDSNVFIPSGKNGLVIGPVTVGVGITIDVATGLLF
jgi:hypothetical protein